jgi:cytochrome c553
VAFLAVLGTAGIRAQGPAASVAFKQVDSLEARVQGCVTCHGQDGRGGANGAFPRIAGKPASYLFNQLVAFRDRTRHYPPMNYLVAYLPDSYLREMADYFAHQRPPEVPMEKRAVDNAVVARGQALATAGDARTGVPACASCHGAGFTGMEPGIPGLAGLNPTYIEGQLTRWRVGERRAAEPDCMRRIASRLSEADIAAVAAWLGQQPLPKDPSPENRNLVRMPFACGSQR